MENKEEKIEKFCEELIKSQEKAQKEIEEGIKYFLTDNPMMSVIMVSQKKYLMAGRQISNIVSLARMMVQQPFFKEMVKKALKIADGDYEIIKEHYVNHQKIIDSLFEK